MTKQPTPTDHEATYAASKAARKKAHRLAQNRRNAARYRAKRSKAPTQPATPTQASVGAALPLQPGAPDPLAAIQATEEHGPGYYDALAGVIWVLPKERQRP